MSGNDAQQNHLYPPYNFADDSSVNGVYPGDNSNAHVYPGQNWNTNAVYPGQPWSTVSTVAPVGYSYGHAQSRIITLLAEYQDPYINHIGSKLEEANQALKQERKKMESRIKEMKVAYAKQEDKLERYEHLMAQGTLRNTN